MDMDNNKNTNDDIKVNVNVTNNSKKDDTDDITSLIMNNIQTITSVLEEAIKKEQQKDTNNEDQTVDKSDTNKADWEAEVKTLKTDNEKLQKEYDALQSKYDKLNSENESNKEQLYEALKKINNISANNVFIPNEIFAKMMNGIIVSENAGTIDHISSDIIKSVKDTNANIKTVQDDSPTKKFRVKRIPITRDHDKIFNDLIDRMFDPFFFSR